MLNSVTPARIGCDVGIPEPVARLPRCHCPEPTAVDTIGHSVLKEPVVLLATVSFPTDNTDFPKSNKLSANCISVPDTAQFLSSKTYRS